MSAFADHNAAMAEAWGAAPWEKVAEGNAQSHDALVELLDPKPGERFLDVGTGTGAVAIRAARRGATVVGVDIAPNLLETARRLAAEEGLEVVFDQGDAAALPYHDASFDVVASSFGVMFAPDHETAASELARVCGKGGRLGLTTQHPDSTAPRMFRHLWRYRPLPDGAGDPIAWGDERYVRDLLGEWFDLEIETVEAEPHQETDPEKVWAFLLSSMGLFKSVYESLDPDEQARFKDEYFELLDDRPMTRMYLRILGRRR